MGILSRLGRVACSTVLPHTRLNREVDILTEPLGVMERMNLLCLEKDMVAEAAQVPGQHLAHNWPLTWPPGPGLTLRTRKLLSILPPLALALAALICDELNNIAGAGPGLEP